MPEQTLTTPASPTATTDAMIPQTPAAKRPEGLPEKFKTVEDMAKSYAELEKKLGTPETKQEAVPEKPTEAQDALLKPYFDEFAKNGKLSDDSYKALAGKGISKDVVDAYAKTVQANDPAKILESVGGKEVFDQISEWSTSNLTAEERADYNAALAVGGASAKVALQALKSRMDSSFGIDPSKRVSGKSSPSVTKFASSAEMVKAIADPRYQHDPAYRDKVAAMIP